jgi:hypothetical protein
MKKSKNYISQVAAVENLKRLFATSPNSDQLSLEELFIAAARDDQPPQTNRNWLANKMTQMKYHDLIQPVYKYGKRKELVALQLTLRGKKVLGRISPQAHSSQSLTDASLSGEINTLDVAAAVRAFRDNYPEFEVTFDIRLKKI